MPFRFVASSIQSSKTEIVSLHHTDFHYRARLLFL